MLDTPRRGFSVGCESGSEVGVLLRELSVVEQRYQAVLAVVEDRLSVTDVAEKVGVCRQSLHEWLRRYAEEGLAGWPTGRTVRGRVVSASDGPGGGGAVG
jgi:transposase